MIILGLLLWYLIGVGSFIWHETYNDDVSVFGCLVCLIMGIFGPFLFIIGFVIHPRKNEEFFDKVIFKRRKR